MFNYIEVKDKALLQEVYKFRYNIFNEIYPNYIEELSLENNTESDKYDKYSIHFVVLKDKEICANVRLIYHSPIGYPTEEALEFDKSSFNRNHLGEISRIFIKKEFRNLKDTKKIIDGLKKNLYHKMLDLNINYTYGLLEKNFLRLLQIYKMKYEIIGKCQVYKVFGIRCPCILYTKKLGIDNYEI